MENKATDISLGKIFCLRMNDGISRINCVPNSNPDICPSCPDRQVDNVKSIDVLSKEEEDERKYGYGSHMGGSDLYGVNIGY